MLGLLFWLFATGNGEMVPLSLTVRGALGFRISVAARPNSAIESVAHQNFEHFQVLMLHLPAFLVAASFRPSLPRAASLLHEFHPYEGSHAFRQDGSAIWSKN